MHSAPALAPTAPPTRLAIPQQRAPREDAPQPDATREPRARWARLLLAWAKPLAGVGILGFLLWRVGTGPFLDGVRLIDGWALLAALVIGALTTVCCAWRWSLVSGGLGVHLPLRTAVAECYQATFLNSTLPGGVLGDVDRAVRHGREAGNVGRGVRAVVWERTAGQVVQLVIAVVVLSALPSPVRAYMPAVAGIALVTAVGLAVLSRVRPRGGFSRLSGALRTARSDVRDGLLARGNWLRVLVASTVVVFGHLATFLIAAYTAGATAPLLSLVPLTLLALLAMGVPANIGGFGPREGVAAWAFAAAGLTATEGVTAAVVYGALALVSTLPGAAVLVARRLRVRAVLPQVVLPQVGVPQVAVPQEGAVSG